MSGAVATLIGAVRPVTLAAPEHAAAAGPSVWVWIAVALALCAVAGALVSYFAWRDRRRHTPGERAFRVMARRLRLGRRERALVHAAAERARIPGIALLISEHAFDRAAPPDDPALTGLRRRLFG